MHNFGIRLKEERNRIGYTQESIAKECCISLAAYKNYEANKTHPDTKVLFAFKDLGINIIYLLMGKSEEPHEDKSPQNNQVIKHNIVLDEQEKEWLKIFKELEPDEKQSVLKFISRNGINALLALISTDLHMVLTVMPKLTKSDIKIITFFSELSPEKKQEFWEYIKATQFGQAIEDIQKEA